jgi:hypothetical protein
MQTCFHLIRTFYPLDAQWDACYPLASREPHTRIDLLDPPVRLDAKY